MKLFVKYACLISFSIVGLLAFSNTTLAWDFSKLTGSNPVRIKITDFYEVTLEGFEYQIRTCKGDYAGCSLNPPEGEMTNLSSILQWRAGAYDLESSAILPKGDYWGVYLAYRQLEPLSEWLYDLQNAFELPFYSEPSFTISSTPFIGDTSSLWTAITSIVSQIWETFGDGGLFEIIIGLALGMWLTDWAISKFTKKG